MLWKAFTLLIFLVMLQDQGTSGSDMKIISMPVIVGSSIKLQPIRIPQHSESMQFTWFVKLSSTQENFKIWSWRDDSKGTFEGGQFKNRVNVIPENLALFISPAQKNDSGLYFMEITSRSGHVSKTAKFQVSVFDPVQDPKIEVTGESWNNTLCHVNLSCFVHGNNNLTYTWYRGREQIKAPGNHAHVQLYIQASNTENYYTCNASNPVSSRSHTVNLTWVCASTVHSSTQELWFLLVLGFSVIPLVILLLSIIVCLYVTRKRKKRRKQVADTNMTNYTKINHSMPQRNQVQNCCATEEGNTCYSVVQFPQQPPASSPASQDKTVYSSVQFSKRSFSKQMNPSSSHSTTIYQEVQRPNRLSRKELEMFCVYS
ncbi:natural killer cell receptor 2B4 [Trichosurus vulpecula]|uniref:natural killer cell receptor 2B4 n=1 Tax=Trichosurus vulpecula TaxID=9337 RepID=UPI00186B1EF4|nr:natural killer cell receptor 2B4 [Trichosurus vulpecula]